MPFKKHSRRTFLTSSSVLAFLHTPFARALPAQQSVNINDYTPHDWLASCKHAFSEGQTVVVPAGLVCLHTPFARALPAQQSVNINDYTPHDWLASCKHAFSEGQTVVVPAGLVCDNINTGIFIPAGKTLHILGSLRGNGRGRFVLQDGSQAWL